MKRGKEKKKEKTLLQMMRSRGTSPTYFRGLPCQTILRFPKREKREREKREREEREREREREREERAEYKQTNR